MKKKVLAMIVGVAMLATLVTGCGSSGSNAAEPAEEESAEAEAPEEEAAPAEEAEAPAEEEAEAPAETEGGGLKIAILSSPSGVDDGSFNETSYNGILAFIANHPDCTVTPVKEETGDVAACIQTLSDIVADYDVFVCDGFQFAAIGTIARMRFPYGCGSS